MCQSYQRGWSHILARESSATVKGPRFGWLKIVEREKRAGPFPVDPLAEDPEDRPAVMEC